MRHSKIPCVASKLRIPLTKPPLLEFVKNPDFRMDATGSAPGSSGHRRRRTALSTEGQTGAQTPGSQEQLQPAPDNPQEISGVVTSEPGRRRHRNATPSSENSQASEGTEGTRRRHRTTPQTEPEGASEGGGHQRHGADLVGEGGRERQVSEGGDRVRRSGTVGTGEEKGGNVRVEEGNGPLHHRSRSGIEGSGGEKTGRSELKEGDGEVVSDSGRRRRRSGSLSSGHGEGSNAPEVAELKEGDGEVVSDSGRRRKRNTA